MKNIKAFTLVEMLMVLVLIGLILGIGVPAVMQIVENKSDEEYRVQLKVTDKAVDLYALRYQGDFKEYKDSDCFLLNYQNLIDEGLIIEEDVKCNGNIVLTKKSNNNYKKDYFLRCVDSTNNKELSSYEESSIPTTCLNLSNLIDIEDSNVTPPTIQGGSKNWKNTDVEISVLESGTPVEDVNYYEYYLGTDPSTPSRGVFIPTTQRKTTTDTKVKVTAEGTTYVWYRVVNKKQETSSWSNREEVNIDKTTPSAPTITASDGKGSGVTHTDSFALSFNVSRVNVSGNTFYYGTASNALTNIASSINVDSSFNNQTIYVKACNGTGACSSVSSYIVKY